MTREEAIKIIKKRISKQSWCTSDEDMKALYKAIPELRESEDERIRKFLIDILSSGVWRPEWPFSPVDCVSYLEKQKEQKQWSEDIIQKAIKEVGLTQHQIDWFKTNVFPPKQEWSEENDRAIRDACCCLAEYAGYLISEHSYDKAEMLWKLSEKLKSLRPQPYWKSSKEQMDALKNVAYGYYQSGDGPMLRELYDDLVKNL